MGFLIMTIGALNFRLYFSYSKQLYLLLGFTAFITLSD
ncbi:hypothetical protein AQPE_2992 [Aquipluma nitroreducens]|uniref:Uncharacterized protein n=1 Tax=Aquipluma nitroreducens TaxID=2010828 RepID=A0A5K7SBY5_9BACT|nr:hypothetical protein AQPE_2992 [Aquipluma nitroreducens]